MDVPSQLRAGKLAGARRLDLSCGLDEFPREILDLADTLEVLNLTGNRLRVLPDDLGRLKHLRILFCSENDFDHLPEVIGTCPRLSMVGFKANRIEHVSERSIAPPLRWLILTDNDIEHLPGSLGECTALQKLMLSGNRLTSLPESLARCERLELIRLATNRFEELPDWLFSLPRLSWLALAGNPCTPSPSLDSLPSPIHWSDLELHERLGEGASGIIHRASWKPRNHERAACEVAVKIFKGGMTSDGLPSSEIAAALTVGAHPNLVRVLGHVIDHPSGADAMVMDCIDRQFAPLAGPPSLDTCTRDVYPADRRFSPETTLRLANALASIATHLHRHGITHGDFYAHNVLWNGIDSCVIGDLGAASFIPPSLALPMERIEVRAFGCLLEELFSRTEWARANTGAATAMSMLLKECLHLEPAQRPSFNAILDRLAAIG